MIMAKKLYRLKHCNFQIKNNMSKENKTSGKTQNSNEFTDDVGIRFLPFNNIFDLIRKVENIKKVFKTKSEIFKQELKERGINFTPIDNDGIIIDLGLLSDEDFLFIKNQDYSFIQKVYDENGVVSNG